MSAAGYLQAECPPSQSTNTDKVLKVLIST